MLLDKIIEHRRPRIDQRKWERERERERETPESTFRCVCTNCGRKAECSLSSWAHWNALRDSAGRPETEKASVRYSPFVPCTLSGYFLYPCNFSVCSPTSCMSGCEFGRRTSVWRRFEIGSKSDRKRLENASNSPDLSVCLPSVCSLVFVLFLFLALSSPSEVALA